MSQIDCLLIGHNEVPIKDYEAQLEFLGKDSEVYKELSLNFIQIDGIPHSFQDVCNRIFSSKKEYEPFHMTETFSNAIAYLGTYLNKHGVTFDYINSFQNEKEQLILKLKSHNILTIAITTTLYVSPFPIIEIIDFIKTYNQKAKIIIGGPFIFHQVKALSPVALESLFKDIIKADIFVNNNQGENTLLQIINKLKENLDLQDVSNIYYKKNEQLLFTKFEKENNLLNDNLVNWNIFAKNKYKHIHIRTSISCPFHCSFCACPDHQGEYQKISPEIFKQELDSLKNYDNLESIYFIDDTLNFPVNKFKDFLRMLINNKEKFKWHSYFRCQFADEEMVELMKLSGCVGVYLGLESGSNRILENMNKHSDVERYLKGIEFLQKYKIITHGSFVVGFPGETDKTIEETITFIKSCGIDYYRAQLWFFDPLTPIAKEKKKYGLQGANFNWEHNTMNSKYACEKLEKIFLEIEDPISVPTYNFDFHNLLHIHYKGISWEKVNNLLRNFNNIIKSKISNNYPYIEELNIKKLSEYSYETN